MTCGSHYRTIIPHVKIIMREKGQEKVNVLRVIKATLHSSVQPVEASTN